MRELLIKPWTDDELMQLEDLLKTGRPVVKIARKRRRTQSSVRGKMVEFGLRRAALSPSPLGEKLAEPRGSNGPP